MIKKIFMLICLILFFCNFVKAEENKTKISKQEYLNQLNAYSEDFDNKFASINSEYKNNYKKEITKRKQEISLLEDKANKYHTEYYICYENESWAELSKSPCGKYIGKTTLLKGSSGLVYADDTYALNKCLAKTKIAWSKKDPCKKYMDNYDNAKKQIEKLNKEIKIQYDILSKQKKTQINALINDFELKSDELYQDCRKTYPRRSSIFGYCDGLSMKIEFDN